MMQRRVYPTNAAPDHIEAIGPGPHGGQNQRQPHVDAAMGVGPNDSSSSSHFFGQRGPPPPHPMGPGPWEAVPPYHFQQQSHDRHQRQQGFGQQQGLG
eukprot:CAMPEP_0113584540 /NCGR_PEP_ID=MMETSP0015_2-20120614/33165_1 /TAXON_ID=2838 /ORGANISM="Odontella" /LENGTH=97 /DNA_ID=CAMNT_0000489611 /DNA_START=181 /DNA_END=470 /DNA_ORIENTATION=+ /assembly_acc=CAM_ASM_000160